MELSALLQPMTAVTFLVIIISTLYLTLRWLSATLIPRGLESQSTQPVVSLPPELRRLAESITSKLSPESVIYPSDHTGEFRRLSSDYWAQQEQESKPGCIVRPCDAQELSVVVSSLKSYFDEHVADFKNQAGPRHGLLAVRGGGHSPVPRAATVEGGIQIDLSRFKQVALSKDRKSAVVGAGCTWGDVSRVLDQQDVAVVGGRNADVGVAGLTLGGGVSFFTPGHGLVCSNVLVYEVVLADGSIVRASASSHPDLWKALKGGSNNFGIVTSFTLRCVPLPGGKVWGGFVFFPWFEASRALEAFHHDVKGPDRGGANPTRDKHAVGPLLAFSYVPALGMDVIAASLNHTDPGGEKGWPKCWKVSPFARLWRVWSTCKVQSLSSATAEHATLNPKGRRQMFGTIMVKNDMQTLRAVHAAYTDTFGPIKRAKVPGLLWTFIVQPLLPDWVRKGDPNSLGLGGDPDEDDPLVLVSFSINWDVEEGDKFVKSTARKALEKMERAAEVRGTGVRFRYLNYCAEWQRPLESYGKDNLDFLKRVSRKHDPEGLFQLGCCGGFKLGRDDLSD